MAKRNTPPKPKPVQCKMCREKRTNKLIVTHMPRKPIEAWCFDCHLKYKWKNAT